MRLFRRRHTRPETEPASHEREPGMSGGDSQPIADVVARIPVRVEGVVTQMRMRPTAGLPALAVTMTDASGVAVAVFTGRRSIGGISLGRRLAVEGVPVRRGTLVEFINPAYALLPASAHS